MLGIATADYDRKFRLSSRFCQYLCPASVISVRKPLMPYNPNAFRSRLAARALPKSDTSEPTFVSNISLWECCDSSLVTRWLAQEFILSQFLHFSLWR